MNTETRRHHLVVAIVAAVLAVGSSLPFFVLARIMIDVARDPTSHNLFPFEIVFSLFFAYPTTMLGALAGHLTRRWFAPHLVDTPRSRR